jgi:RNA polymerase sigma-70 factor (ECF subfamily)
MDAERGLMERVARGDQGAFSDLAQRYSGKLLAVAGRLLGSRADAEDAVQRAFLQCYAGARGYNPRWAVSTWLYRILTNVCVDELRRRATRTAHDERSAGGPLSSTNHPPPDAYLGLHPALARVPREARCPGPAYVDGLSYGFLARIRGITINTVKSRSRGRPRCGTSRKREQATNDGKMRAQDQLDRLPADYFRPETSPAEWAPAAAAARESETPRAASWATGDPARDPARPHRPGREAGHHRAARKLVEQAREEIHEYPRGQGVLRGAGGSGRCPTSSGKSSRRPSHPRGEARPVRVIAAAREPPARCAVGTGPGRNPVPSFCPATAWGGATAASAAASSARR